MSQFGNNPYDPFGGGYPVGGNQYGTPPIPQPPQQPSGEVNTCATLSVVFAFLFAPAGIVLGHVALSQCNRTGQRGRDRAIVGLVLSYVAVAVTVVALVVWLALDDRPSAPTASTTSSARASTSATTTTTTTTTTPPAPLPDAQSLLLPDGSATPAGVVTAQPIGDNYFTSVDPPNCTAAVLFKNSPLPPPGQLSHAESAYQVQQHPVDQLLAESVNVYQQALDPGDIVRSAMSTVSACTTTAVGIAAAGQTPNMRLTNFAIAGDGVLTWAMSRSDWNCDYGLAITPHAALLTSMCASTPGFPMQDWATQRRQQILGSTAR